MTNAAVGKSRIFHTLNRSRGMFRLFSTLRPKESGPNAHILNMLHDCIAAEEALSKQNIFKIRAFRKAIQIIRLQENEIVDAEAARRLKGVGKGIGGRIAAFLSGQEYVMDAASLDSNTLIKSRSLNRTLSLALTMLLLLY